MKDTNQIVQKSRREFLGMLSKAGISAGLCRAMPLVGGLMATRFAHAQSSGGAIKRAVFVYTPDGSPNGLWLPNGTTLAPSTAAYEGLQSLCNFREVNVVASGHGNPRKAMGELRWSQDWTSDSIDQQIASVVSVGTPYPSYALGVQTDTQNLVTRRSGSAIPAQDSPTAAYEQLFSSAPPATDAAAFLAKKQAVMNLHRSSISELKTKLGAFERQTLEKHEAALDEVEQRLIDSVNTEPAEGCESPAFNGQGYGQPVLDGATAGAFEQQAELQSDIITTALQCGLTNVMTLQLGWHQATWYGHNTAYRGDHHGSCHSAPADANAEMTNYLSRCVAYLVRKLMEQDDPAVPGTKLIDNTVVVQVTDMGDGRDHSGGNGPNMVATRMAGFRQGTVGRGGSNLEMLESIVEGMGLGAYKGTDVNAHKIWPCAGGQYITDILT